MQKLCYTSSFKMRVDLLLFILIQTISIECQNAESSQATLMSEAAICVKSDCFPRFQNDASPFQYVLTKENTIKLKECGSALSPGDTALPLIPYPSLKLNPDPIFIDYFNQTLHAFLLKFNPEAIPHYEEVLLLPDREKLLPSFCEIKFISNSVGFGVFATQDIEEGRVIGEYTGVVSLWIAIKPECRYSYSCGPRNLGFSDFAICAYHGNFTRFINHGFPQNCNLAPRTYYNKSGPHILFETIKPIKKGDQLLYDYGLGYWTRMKVEPEQLS